MRCQCWLATLADAEEASLGFDHDDVRRLIDHRLPTPALRVAGVAEVTHDLDLVVGETERVGRGGQPDARAKGAEPG
jgi:hypothetical protein